VNVTATGDRAEVRVRDTGVGLVTEALDRIFDLFSQEDTPLDRQQGGLGIGLTLVKRLVELHGGTVEARSAGRGCGSEFVVRFPLLPPALPLDATLAEDRAASRSARFRVLIVEDNIDAAESLAAGPRPGGHRTPGDERVRDRPRDARPSGGAAERRGRDHGIRPRAGP